LTTDQLSVDPEHAIPRAPQLLIPSRISALAPGVIASINFHDQPFFGRKEINDETEHRNLATNSTPVCLERSAAQSAVSDSVGA
jgi:hypothetical protein